MGDCNRCSYSGYKATDRKEGKSARDVSLSSGSAKRLVCAGAVYEAKSAAQFYQYVQGAEKAVVDFYTSWCGPCRGLSPLFKEAAAAHAGKVVYIKVDAEALEPIAEKMNVTAYPTFIFFTKGAVVKKLTTGDAADLKKALRNHAAD